MSNDLTQIYSLSWDVCECNMSGSFKYLGRTGSQNFYFYCKFLKNHTFDNMDNFTMVYVTLRPFSYYFLIGTEVNFTVTSAGASHHLNERVMNFLKMTKRFQILSILWFYSRHLQKLWVQFFDLKLNIYVNIFFDFC